MAPSRLDAFQYKLDSNEALPAHWRPNSRGPARASTSTMFERSVRSEQQPCSPSLPHLPPQRPSAAVFAESLEGCGREVSSLRVHDLVAALGRDVALAEAIGVLPHSAEAARRQSEDVRTHAVVAPVVLVCAHVRASFSKPTRSKRECDVHMTAPSV